jgi:hypothetical protein
MLLAAQRIAGRSTDAEVSALRIIEAQKEYARLFALGAPLSRIRFAAAAFVTLDDEDRMRELREALLDEDGGLVEDYQVSSYVALSRLDLDRAVELLLAQKAQHPSWYGTDMIAAFHIWARPIVMHPDMQRFYVDEGKWVDYLATGVPEYAQYRQ